MRAVRVSHTHLQAYLPPLALVSEHSCSMDSASTPSTGEIDRQQPIHPGSNLQEAPITCPCSEPCSTTQTSPQAEAANDAAAPAAAAAAAGAAAVPPPQTQKPRLRRLIRLGIAAIRAILFVEAVSLVVGPLVAEHLRSRQQEDDEQTDSDLDPADVLMDYLTGKIGLAPLQLLTNKQLKQAVDNLVTEDFQELGVKDRGAQIREIVDDIIQAKKSGGRVPEGTSSSTSSSSSRYEKPVNREDRSGLGRLGPLRFRNSRQPLRTTATSSGPQAAEAAQDEAAAPVAGRRVPGEVGSGAAVGSSDHEQQ